MKTKTNLVQFYKTLKSDSPTIWLKTKNQIDSILAIQQ